MQLARDMCPLAEPERVVLYVLLGDARIAVAGGGKAFEQPVPELPVRGCSFDKSRVEGAGEGVSDLHGQIEPDLPGPVAAGLAPSEFTSQLVKFVRQNVVVGTRALTTCQTRSNSPDSSARSASASSSTKTGITTVPTVLSRALRIALPTACTMSTCDRRGSMNATPSRVGTSAPSARQRALVSAPRCPWLTARSRLRRLSRSPLGIAPETCSAHNEPSGRRSAGNHAPTSSVAN